MYTAQAPSRPVHRQFSAARRWQAWPAPRRRCSCGPDRQHGHGREDVPAPSDSAAGILAYFHDHQDAVKVSAFFQFAASVPLGIYAATVSSRLWTLGIRAPGATIALAGGALAAAFLSIARLVTWTLAQPAVLASPVPRRPGTLAPQSAPTQDR